MNLPNQSDTLDTKITTKNIKKTSKSRQVWVGFVWALTWWVPNFLLRTCAGMKNAQMMMAWREKVASCIIIMLSCATVLFLVVGAPMLICPVQPVMSPGEVTLYASSSGPKPRASMYGRIIDMSEELKSHLDYGVEGEAGWKGYLGTDVSDLFFPVDHFGEFCPGLTPPSVAWDNLAERSERYYHRRQNPSQPGTYINYINFLNKYAVGRLVHTWDTIRSTSSRTRKLVVIYDNVYDVSRYDDAQPKFLGDTLATIFNNNIGKDMTNSFEQLKQVDPNAMTYLACMNHLFYIGQIDHRNDVQCQATNYTLLVISSLIVALIGVKFLSSLQCNSGMDPVDQSEGHKVIMMVPCYTEGQESVQKTFESLATSKWDAKHKLLFVICDGMVTGAGNDRPTPRIVLDLLGVETINAEPPLPFSYHAISNNQVNFAQVYSGLYEIQGELVPFVVVVKVGCPGEVGKPGNRGKRDSQILLFRFLQRCFAASVEEGDSVMNPLELEILHHFTNHIGVNPSDYDFVMTVDADTRVECHALNQLVSSMESDSKIMGICGETKVDNEGASFWSGIQVFEYWISHHLGKSFESLFGTVTCLPGCFSLFRLKTQSGKPILIAPQIIDEYAEMDVETLHRKNLYLLGEDRYLTTLLLKHFPTYKLSFTQSAIAWTMVPETWKVLLSQRRRWINSTVHNLIELLSLSELCGCFLFSMRFVVFMDLVSTVVQPAGFGYLIYLLYMVCTSSSSLPMISMILLGCIYGLQVLLFLWKREWSMIIWSLLYLISLPLYAVVLPLYSFWHFDDFSWGSTRRVNGDKGKGHDTSEQGDVSSVPLIPSKQWPDYIAMKIKQAEVDAMDGKKRSSILPMVPLIYQNLPKWNTKSQSVYYGEYPPRPASSAASLSTLAPRSIQDFQPRPVSFSGYPGFPRAGFDIPIPTRPASVGLCSSEPSVDDDKPVSLAHTAIDIGYRMPSDERLIQEIQHIIKDAVRRGDDLSKRLVREALADEFFGVDLTGKREWLNRVIGEELGKILKGDEHV